MTAHRSDPPRGIAIGLLIVLPIWAAVILVVTRH